MSYDDVFFYVHFSDSKEHIYLANNNAVILSVQNESIHCVKLEWLLKLSPSQFQSQTVSAHQLFIQVAFKNQ